MSETLHPVVRAAAGGQLPEWAVASERRREHMGRVSTLLRDWAKLTNLLPDETERWASLGYLHDALRDQDPAELRDLVPTRLAGLPGRVLHGPAAAERLKADGVDDPELLNAITYHTLGHRDFGTLGCSLYVADFLEPGRSFRRKWREELRARMPEALKSVTREIVGARIRHLVDRNRPVRPETMGFWNTMTTGEPWAAASQV